MKKIVVIAFLFSVAIFSCKKPKEETPKQTPPPKVFHIPEVKLDNQYVTNGNHFFQVYDGKRIGYFRDSIIYKQIEGKSPIPNDSLGYFDLCYLNYNAAHHEKFKDKNTHFICGSTNSGWLTMFEKSKRPVFTKEDVIFYTVPSSFSYAHFDTIKTGLGITKLIREECTEHKFLGIGPDVSAFTIGDGFGWAKNTLFAFRNTGRYKKVGLVKILDTPTGSYITKTPGSVRLEIKFIVEK
ncbi:MAG: hypothetical protein SNJ77_11070 [Cytophagales bacterium]